MPRSIQSTPDLGAFVDRLVASGRHQNADEVVADALSLLQEREANWDARAEELAAQIAKNLEDLAAGRTVPADVVFGEARA